MTKARLDGLILFLLGSAVFLLLGSALEISSSASMNDFKPSYYGARCLLQHCDPYDQSNLLRLYHAEEGARLSDSPRYLTIATTELYLPPGLVLMVPFACLPFGPAHVLWIACIAVSFILASFLMWDFGAGYSPVISGCLVGFFIANSELLIFTGNPAGVAVALCVVAAWCFLRGRFIPAGILCLALSLAFKPHDSGLVWLFFLLAGGVYRKRALQTLAAVATFSLPAAIWTTSLSPHWIQELHSNLAMLSAHGAISDPGPASAGAHGLAMIIDMQSVFSVFWDDPRFYNPASYLLSGALLLVFVVVTLRTRPSPRRAWFALASIAALSMLPIYHRQYDAKLVLLTVPACLILWAERGRIGRIALLVNALGFVVVADLPWVALIRILARLPNEGLAGWCKTAAQVFPVPLALLIMGTFYLWVYVRSDAAPPASTEP